MVFRAEKISISRCFQKKYPFTSVQSSKNEKAPPWLIYVAKQSITVPAGLRLVIEPGVIIKFDEMTSLTVEGSIEAKGKTGEEVIFTTLKNDERGGDINGDGYATGPAAMDWEGIEIRTMSAEQIFENVVIEYANCGLKSAKNRYLNIENAVFQNNGAENFRYNDQKMEVQEGIPYNFREIIETATLTSQNDTVKLEKASKKMYWMLGGLGVGLAAAGIIYLERDKAGTTDNKTTTKTPIQDPSGPPAE
ncbi:MAG: hypothetical protein A2248_02290 [Candidatus Raymondbacteria bacterium RIFOXYA2_FULL_49_16]|uniref:Right handed beta helix domain-containing protein n=1 Tax=Candidatus Raymondbacteria bacterium RIFOXYD12_FULL_49_13 TaxID=1817890 RepID=A0A1F7FIS5_UNCRA|nr:MAG: hypothetical protein A2248_02290 [Candidatus Raymondbacteria bacterium RIFOXYA2_FULL_49_16]OGJ97371.1 MAG: hypothetical protein A2453_03570 [Candidatus Raymondbacteria bacterium RIFOXYC2_FULL_50_21]OGK06533.1 MAG: hypothetical protein A2519_04375 [Candidatus Raymondbacteria bacterium RIFOXYD12_FULL_49_13]OGP43543.1 MAG: hypothetical protein A2324_14035 [Candidatus Raymondbacteria bacterium RIFOXYB2_FULL_49_35]